MKNPHFYDKTKEKSLNFAADMNEVLFSEMTRQNLQLEFERQMLCRVV